MLIVLDNLEHLIDYASQLIYELLHSCPHLKIIITSREALRITGERIFAVPPLSIPSKIHLQFISMEAALQYPALKLFVERASAVSYGFQLESDNIWQVAEICRKLDGIPLAIELLAARSNIMSPGKLLAHLNEGLVLFTKSKAQIPSYHESLYQAIDWSYRYLSANEKHLFENLSVFLGGFTLEEIEEAFIDVPYNAQVTELLASLVEKSIVQVEVNLYGDQRFTLLTTIQQFASQKLAESGQEAVAHYRHLDYFLRFAKSAYQVIYRNEVDQWSKAIEVEQNNLRSALNWCIATQQTSSALFLLTVLSWFWSSRGNSTETSCWFGLLQSLPDIREQLMANEELSVRLGQWNVDSNPSLSLDANLSG